MPDCSCCDPPSNFWPKKILNSGQVFSISPSGSAWARHRLPDSASLLQHQLEWGNGIVVHSGGGYWTISANVFEIDSGTGHFIQYPDVPNLIKYDYSGNILATRWLPLGWLQAGYTSGLWAFRVDDDRFMIVGPRMNIDVNLQPTTQGFALLLDSHTGQTLGEQTNPLFVSLYGAAVIGGELLCYGGNLGTVYLYTPDFQPRNPISTAPGLNVWAFDSSLTYPADGAPPFFNISASWFNSNDTLTTYGQLALGGDLGFGAWSTAFSDLDAFQPDYSTQAAMPLTLLKDGVDCPLIDPDTGLPMDYPTYIAGDARKITIAIAQALGGQVLINRPFQPIYDWVAPIWPLPAGGRDIVTGGAAVRVAGAREIRWKYAADAANNVLFWPRIAKPLWSVDLSKRGEFVALNSQSTAVDNKVWYQKASTLQIAELEWNGAIGGTANQSAVFDSPGATMDLLVVDGNLMGAHPKFTPQIFGLQIPAGFNVLPNWTGGTFRISFDGELSLPVRYWITTSGIGQTISGSVNLLIALWRMRGPNSGMGETFGIHGYFSAGADDNNPDLQASYLRAMERIDSGRLKIIDHQPEGDLGGQIELGFRNSSEDEITVWQWANDGSISAQYSVAQLFRTWLHTTDVGGNETANRLYPESWLYGSASYPSDTNPPPTLGDAHGPTLAAAFGAFQFTGRIGNGMRQSENPLHFIWYATMYSEVFSDNWITKPLRF